MPKQKPFQRHIIKTDCFLALSGHMKEMSEDEARAQMIEDLLELEARINSKPFFNGMVMSLRFPSAKEADYVS